MSREPQYVFRDDEHWWDQWNEVRDDSDDPWLEDFPFAEGVLELGCGCGNPEVIVAAMLDYLQRIDMRAYPTIRDEHRVADLLLAYQATRADLAEHGGSIYGAWPTDGGRRWMVLAAEYLARMDAE